MTAIDDVLTNNASYAAGFNTGIGHAPPARNLAVVACMDARLDTHKLLGLEVGDAHVIRNAGGIVSDDVIRSLIISSGSLAPARSCSSTTPTAECSAFATMT